MNIGISHLLLFQGEIVEDMLRISSISAFREIVSVESADTHRQPLPLVRNLE